MSWASAIPFVGGLGFLTKLLMPNLTRSWEPDFGLRVSNVHF